MKNILNVNRIARMTLSAVMMISTSAQALIETSKVPSVKLEQVIPGATVQAVEDIPNQDKLSLMYNDLLLNQKMNLPGWDASTGNLPDAKGIFNAFAIRTTQNPAVLNANNSVFYAGKGVGRSGVWEKQATGDAFAYINGRPLKGLTIKGYGGNAGRNYQPDGSLDAAEAHRDTLLSKVLMEKGADTYVGALAVVRPRDGGSTQANYIRLSRSTLRMNDLMDRTGQELRNTVDHLSALVAEEAGKTLTAQEFADWLVQRSARTLAAKEHARVTASNHNKDNFGIAEVVDFGEAKYAPFDFVHGRDVLGDPKSSWSAGLKVHVVAAAQNIAKEYGFQKDFSAEFDKVYQERTKTLVTRDMARLNLDKATKAEMKSLGLSDVTVERIETLRSQLSFGLLSTEEVISKISMVDADKTLIRQQTTTSAMRMADGHIVPNALLGEVGGADGLREVLTKAMASLTTAELADEAKIREKVSAQLKEKMTALGTDKYVVRGYGADIQGNLSVHFGRKISSETAQWNAQYLTATKLKTLGAVGKCQAVF
ncbi:hypothetical protein AZI86_03075 [Bdellovibrio bacteriovorus]|uniref:Uncharacterized protein n=1 Tax=Bdellovibrio bacteriovorus TaxID=959 RepID=A0A150WNI6_BDEBC|nr:hypothetical protein [Bdellovibrio bacteriovorus]KYG66063.1 hypothetical protein AZI86_03075 [Bdellovibrio bacteriovorus]